LPNVQSQFGFTLVFVRAMARRAVFGNDRAYIAIEFDSWGSGAHRALHECTTKQNQAKVRFAKWLHKHHVTRAGFGQLSGSGVQFNRLRRPAAKLAD
jgi:hypothetical protein